MDSSLSTVPIQSQDLTQFTDRANRLLSGVKWTAKPFQESSSPVPGAAVAWRESSSQTTALDELSLMQLGRTIGKDPLLLPAPINQALTVLRQGLSMGMYLSKTYTKFSGLDQLVILNGKGGLAEMQKVEFRNKYQTASAIAVFSAAYYTLWELSQFRRDELSSVRLEIPEIPEVFLQDPVRSLECFVYYLGAFAQRSGAVKTELEFVKCTQLYAQRAVEEVQRRVDSLQYLEPFTAQVYKLENSEFRVEGFKVELSGQHTSVEFNRVELGEIVGNREAKHQARRLVSRLLCYDLKQKRNPMYDLGGISSISLGFGEPGTGKSLLISAIATMLDEQCRELGLPFLFWPMPDTVVSTFQGGSAERMMNWMLALKDPTKIIYAPIDDAENNLEDRSRQGVSAGVREVIAVFLRNTEGAYAVHRGNSLIQLFTNLPDQIDKAVMSRINSRAEIAGAATQHDFLDQDYLWYKRYTEISSGFVNFKAPENYNFLSSQAALHSLADTSDSLKEPSDERMKRIYRSVLSRFDTGGHDFFAALFVEVKKTFPHFTSRDLRNIQRAVDARILDFDFPEDWHSNPDNFFRKDYETKKRLLVEQMRMNMGKLSFADIRLQEVIRYLDNLAKIADSGRERRIGSLVEEFELQKEARQRFDAATR